MLLARFILSWRSALLFCSCLAAAGMLRAAAGTESTPAQLDFFEKRIRPLLVDACYRCHSAGKEDPKGGLRLDSAAALLKGGENGAVISPGRPDQSRLIEAVSGKNPDLMMPPRRPLTPVQVADLTAWVADGAPWPKESAEPPMARAEESAARARRHWAFQPLQKGTPPTLNSSLSSRLVQTGQQIHPIDAFIEESLRRAKLSPPPMAQARSLIRRVAYDLTGLPPSPAEVEEFAAAPSEAAWERWIERLLASPQYGEKWGRHWLDLVRFAETNSYETDDAKPNAWRYRDYVIRAFNNDKPYDRFVREQLAGDELSDGGTEGQIATGFYRLGIWDNDPADKELARYDQLDDLVATTSQVFLGLTVDCARCHDHKIDPILQREYYSMLAFFRNINLYSGGGPNDQIPLTGLEPEARALAVTESRSKSLDTFLLLRGNPNTLGERVEPGFPGVLNPPKPRVVPPSSGRSSGRRLALADWIASPDNPLAARVVANRVWQHHFGRGLVRTPNDFGLQGQPPTHPELLDWLAKDLIESGWSLKHLHRRILTSRAYRASAQPSSIALKLDPGNDLFSRFDMRRLTAEEIRDSILWVSGSGNSKMFGPGMYVTLPKEVLASQSVPGKGWGNSPPDEQLRRSIYVHVKRSLLTPVLLGFDLAETDRSTPVRFATTQPTQALGMMNGAFFNQQASRLADRSRHECGDVVPAQIRQVLHRVTGRPPSTDEVTRGVAYIADLIRDGATRSAALDSFCLLALNLNEFLYLD